MQHERSWRSHRFVCLFFLLAFLAAALLSQVAFAATKVITDADKGGTVHLKTGDTIELRLNANPTTGFMWYLKKGSTPLLKLTGQTQTNPPEPAAGQPVMVGQAVIQIFEFQAKQPGDGVLLFHYVRSWDPPSPDEQQFQIHVVVE